MSRPFVYPDPTKTIAFWGDFHAGSSATTTQRVNKILADLASGRLPVPLLNMQVGDMNETGSAAGQDALSAAFLASLTTLSGAPVRTIAGNHDLLNSRTMAQWITQFATYLQGGTYPYVYDAGIVKLICVGDVDTANGNKLYFTQASLDYLDAQLTANASSDCWIVTHCPLANTVLGPTTGDNPQWSSAEGFFQVTAPLSTSPDDTPLRTVIGNHSNAKAIFTGHTHSDINAPGLLTTLTLGGRSVAHVNCSAITYIGRTGEWTDPLHTIWATKVTGGIEIRVADHGSGTWKAINGSRVTTMTVG